jgi:hypothetical protein
MDRMRIKDLLKTRAARKAKREEKATATRQVAEPIEPIVKVEREEAIAKRRSHRKTRRRVRIAVAVVKAKVRRGKVERKRAAKKAVRRAKIAKARTRRSRAS